MTTFNRPIRNVSRQETNEGEPSLRSAGEPALLLEVRSTAPNQPVVNGNSAGASTPSLRTRLKTVGRNVRPAAISHEAEASMNDLEKLGAQATKLAHDLNNALCPTVMFLDLLKARLKNPAHVRLLEIAKKGLSRAIDMTGDVVSCARGTTPRRASSDPRLILDEVFAAANQTFPGTIGIQMEAPAASPRLNVCPTQLHRALLNLCVNARDAMPEGGTLRLRLTNVEYQFMQDGVEKAVRYVSFEVTDNGTGIPEAMRAKIFEPFFTTKSSGKGTGLGLASVREFVANHGGKLSIQSEMGVGTAFRILLPVMEDQSRWNGSITTAAA